MRRAGGGIGVLGVIAVIACAAAVAAAQPGPGAGSGGSADPGDGSAGSGSARILQLPTGIAAPQVSAAASPTTVRIGARFTVFITATYGDGVEVNIREPIELGSVFEVMRKVSEDKRTPDGRKVREWQLEVVAWELGDLRMPPIAVTFTAFGKAGQVQTNAIKLKITGVLGDAIDDPKALRDHAPPTELLRRDWFWVWIAAGGGAALGLVIGLLVWRRGRRRRAVRLVAGVVAAPRRMDLPSERALEKLRAIEQSGALERDEVSEAGNTEMVEVIREYLAARYRVVITDLTTSELLRQLARAAAAEECALVETWLERCDIVKYGGLRTTHDDAKTTLDDARALVVTTSAPPPGAAKEAA